MEEVAYSQNQSSCDQQSADRKTGRGDRIPSTETISVSSRPASPPVGQQMTLQLTKLQKSATRQDV